MKMNNKNRRKVLLKILNMVYDTDPNTRYFINKSFTEICRNENLPVDEVFSVCFDFICCCLFLKKMFFFPKSHGLSWFVMTNQKVK